LVDSPLIVGWGVVSGWFYPVSYGVAAFICYLYVCVSEQVRDLSHTFPHKYAQIIQNVQELQDTTRLQKHTHSEPHTRYNIGIALTTRYIN